MKKILYTLMLLLSMGMLAEAQTKSDQRTVTTRIADLLLTLPANDVKKLNAGMEELGNLGSAGMQQLIGMLFPVGKGDNTRLKYAINGFSYYVTQPGKAEWRKIATEAYTASLEKTADVENKRFIIGQLLIVGKDDAVPALAKYLSDENLSDATAQALVKVNSTAANQALLQALPNSTGNSQLSIIKALGNAHYTDAAKPISAFVGKGDIKQDKVTLEALADIADPSSETVLTQAAEKAGFKYDVSNATNALVVYTQNLAAKGNKVIAERIAQNLHKKSTGDTRIAALKILTDINPVKNNALLLAAALDSDPKYRAAALRYAKPSIKSPATAWIAQLQKANAEQKAEIIRMFGDYNVTAALPQVLASLKSTDQHVRIAAITAAGKIGQEKVLPGLFLVLQKGTAEDIKAVQQAMLVMKGNTVTTQIAKAIPTTSAHGQVALVNVLAARAAHDKISVILPLVKSKDAGVKNAAFEGLKQVVEEDNLPQLFTLIREPNQPEETAQIQKAIIAAVASSTDKPKQTALVLQQMDQASAEQKSLYFNVLASLGDKSSLKAVSTAFNNGDAVSKKAALTALSQWSNTSASTELFRIAKESTDNTVQELALDGYIQSIVKSSSPAEQKILLLKNAMTVAKAATQKKAIIKGVEKNKTITGLFFAGKYLDDADVQQEAATAVMNITLADKNNFGTNVRALLNKTIEVLKGPDSDYQKEAMRKFLAEMPQGEGFVSMFNGKDLTGWKGLVDDPIKRSKMDAATLAAAQVKADELMRRDWAVQNGEIVFVGQGFDNLTTVKKYGDFEMLVDWKIVDDGKKKGDAGIYLRGTPQVQMWDTSRVKDGAQVGSGGLYNNKINQSKPLKVADNQLGEWNNFRILMKGDRVTVYLNGELVTDNVILENFWDKTQAIFADEQLELQAHGSPVAYRDIYVREIPRPKPFQLSAEEKAEGYKVLFDGTNMYEWTGNLQDYVIDDGTIHVMLGSNGSHGNLYTKNEYSDFIYRFEFKLTPGANNGLGIRAPLTGDAAYTGMELQILDNEADMYKDLKPYQYHGSVYGTIPAKRGFLKPVGEWNYEEVVVKGPKIQVFLNGTLIMDGDITEARKNGAADHLAHPGLLRDTGHIGYLGHGSELWIRNVRVKSLEF
jgi:hypothetical protein